MEEKTMKAYKGYTIIKSYDLKEDGTIKKDTIIYSAFDSDDDLYDSNSNLSTLKKEIDEYVCK